MILLKVKNTISEIKNLLDRINSSVNSVEEKINVLENMAVETISTVERKYRLEKKWMVQKLLNRKWTNNKENKWNQQLDLWKDHQNK